MRAGFQALIFVAAAALPASAQMAVPPSPSNQTYDIPAGSKDQTVMILTRDFKPGESSGARPRIGWRCSPISSTR